MNKNATGPEKDYMNRVAQLGCICCRHLGQNNVPAEIHHKRKGTGVGRRASHYDTLPLCPGHHRFFDDAIHVSPALFVRHYGTEDALIEQVKRAVAELKESLIGH